MAFQNVSRRLWILIGVTVGLLIGQIQSMPNENWRATYGEEIGQRDFETAIRPNADKHVVFHDLTVYTEAVRDVDGLSKVIYVVVGNYDDRRNNRYSDQQVASHQRCFIAQTPYRPLQFPSAFGAPLASVTQFLDGAHAAEPIVTYRIAWWKTSRWARAFWIAMGLCVFGVFVPTLINITVFGRLTRPRSSKNTAKSQTNTVEECLSSDITANGSDDSRLREPNAEIQKNLTTEPSTDPVTLECTDSQSQPVQHLPTEQLKDESVAVSEKPKEFGADRDDFYPTVRHIQRPSSDSSHGFSMIELLVVIAIIGLLLALLLPALASARKSAKNVQCLATLRNIGSASQLHLNEHDGYLPLVGWQFNVEGGVLNPAGVGDKQEKRYIYFTERGEKRPVPVTAALAITMGLEMRIDNRENLVADLQKESIKRLFRCSSQDPQLQSVGSIGDGSGWDGPPEWSSYVFNEALLGRRNQPYNFPQGHIVQVRHTAEVMMAMDGKPRGAFCVFDMNQNFTEWDFHDWVILHPGDGPDVADYTRHAFRTNVLFLDWHVEGIPLTEQGQRSIGISKGIYE
jgi:prepilin-type N-terminal cleavage/methylation domain-containing protein/prepilin-type processing-associated H-X9-DG protein